MTAAALLDRLIGEGIELRRARAGENRAHCPKCGRGPPDDALAVCISHDRAFWLCHRCQWAGVVANDDSRNAQRPQQIKPVPAQLRESHELARAIWNESIPLTDTLGQAYLEGRACLVPAINADIRFHPALFCAKVAQRLPAIVCRVSTVIGNRGVGIHRIFLDAAGSDTAVAKMRLGGCDEPVCIRLFPDDDVVYGLGIAEGIETALAAARLHSPIWSTIDAGQLARFPAIPGVECLTIFADHDKAGLKAARACAQRWEAAGRDVAAVTASEAGTDLNDVVRNVE